VDGNADAPVVHVGQLPLGQTTTVDLGGIALTPYGGDPYLLFESDADATHTVSAQSMQTSCTGQGEDATVDSLGLDVVVIH